MDSKSFLLIFLVTILSISSLRLLKDAKNFMVSNSRLKADVDKGIESKRWMRVIMPAR